MRSLLDVNVLLALLDADHVDHVRARQWLALERSHGWATCAITENGFVRVITQPRYPNPITVTAAIALLGRTAAGTDHEFWPADVSLLDGSVVEPTRVHGPRQVTDAYLFALAVAHGGRLVTFDRSIVGAAVPNARDEHLVVL